MTVSECQNALRDAGKSYPRTCAKCGFGLCKDGLYREQLLAKLAAIEPAPDPRDAVIAQLVGAAEGMAEGVIVECNFDNDHSPDFGRRYLALRDAIAAAKAVM